MSEISLRIKLTVLLNQLSAENGSDTPDFILAEYLLACLSAFDNAVTARDTWWGRGRPSRTQADTAQREDS